MPPLLIVCYSGHSIILQAGRRARSSRRLILYTNGYDLGRSANGIITNSSVGGHYGKRAALVLRRVIYLVNIR